MQCVWVVTSWIQMRDDQKEQLTTLLTDIRIAISCCCSEHRYTEVNQLLDQIERVLNESDSE